MNTDLANIKPYIINYPYHNLNIPAIEQNYGVKYMGPWCVKDRNGNWSEIPVEIFYQPEPFFEKGHSHYLGVFIRHGNVYLTDGQSAFSDPIAGIMVAQNEVVVSRYRHDYRERGGAMIDGGRDYVRMGGVMGTDFHSVGLKVYGSEFYVTMYDREYPCAQVFNAQKVQAA